MSPDPLQRIKELSLHSGAENLAEYESFTYEWRGHGDGSGYERFETKLVGGGGLHYSGIYHPGDGCCEGNPCRYCGTGWHG